MLRLLVWATLFVLIAPAAMAQPIKTPADAVRWLHKRLYPSQYVTPEPPPPPKMKRVIKKPPPTATPAPTADPVEAVPAPRVKPRAQRQRVKKVKATKPRQVVVRPATGISARDCARLRAAYATYGNLINAGGQGYSPAQVAYARRQCGV